MTAISIQSRWRSLRAFSFPLSGLPVVVATAIALPAAKWHVGILVASVLAAVLLHAAGNLLNDYFDFRKGVDRKIEGDEGRPGRVLVRGEMPQSDVLTQALVSLGLVLPLAIYVFMHTGVGLLLFGAVGVISLYIYTGPPLNLKYHAFGEPVITLAFGPALMSGAAYAQTGALHWNVIAFSIPVGLLTMEVLFSNNIRDIDEDGDARITTIAHVLGDRVSRWVYVAFLFIPQLLIPLIVLNGAASRWTLLSLGSLVPAFMLSKKVLSGNRIPDVDARTAQVSTAFLVLLLVGILVGG